MYFLPQLKIARQLGWRKVLSQLLREGDIRGGTLVGTDAFGNKYYERKEFMLGRNRWVDYAKEKNYYEYDGSKIPPEWHRWMHNMCDEPPQADPNMTYRPKFEAPYVPNQTGTFNAYVPFSTARPKYEAWIPPTNTTKK